MTIRRYAIFGLAALVFMAGAAAVGYRLYLGFEVSREAYPVQGIDVSHHQGAIDWDALATAPPHFVYMKASEGGDFRDTRFVENWRESARVGIRRGAYHYFTLCRPGVDQARNFIDAVPVDRAALPPAVDLEFVGNCSRRPPREDFLAELRAYLDLVEGHYGRRALIYTTRSFYRRYLEGDVEDRPYWLRSLVVEPRFRDAGWTVWQYHDRSTRAGIAGPVDLNAFNGSAADFAAFAGPATGGGLE